MGDVSVVESAVTRQLQHAILQLCNEHVSYEHTLQVLGVICVTVDDQPRDLIIKLNNTLKRVDPVAASEDRRARPVRTAAPALWPRVVDGTATVVCSSSTAAGSSVAAGCGVQMPGRYGTAACSQAAPVATVVGNSSVRKCHGRKQTNPVKVKTVVDDDDDNNDDDHEYSTSGGVLLIAPAEPSATDDEPSDVTSPSSSPRLLRSVGGHHRDVGEESPQIGRRHTETPTTGIIESSAAHTLLTTNDSYDDVRRRGCTSKSSVIDTTSDLSEYKPSDHIVDKLRQDSSEQEAALNFSTRTSSSGCIAGGSGTNIKIKDEVHHPSLSMTYGMEMGGSFDMARSMSVAAAAAAFSQYADDPVMLQSLNSYDQQRLALYTSLMTAAATSGVAPAGCDNEPPPPPMSLLNGAALDGGADLPSSPLDRPVAMSSYVMSGRLGDRLTMHRLPAIKRRERFLHHAHQPPVKVKDIIMFDDSAPLNAQRGSRIEGDFMVDALHVEGRKRRRRTAEDTLSAEEVAEYMGTPTSAGTNQFACRYCGEVSTDLSRYFAHTLTAHGSFVCHQCGKSFTTKSSLLRHRPIHTGMRRFACSICHKSFYRKDKCKAHIKRHLGITDGQGPSSSPVGLPRPATPQLPSSIDHQLFASSAVGPVNLAV